MSRECVELIQQCFGCSGTELFKSTVGTNTNVTCLLIDFFYCGGSVLKIYVEFHVEPTELMLVPGECGYLENADFFLLHSPGTLHEFTYYGKQPDCILRTFQIVFV